MKYFLTAWLILLFYSQTAQAQNSADRNRFAQELRALPAAQQDTTRVKLLNNLGFQFNMDKPDTTLILGQQALELSRQLNYTDGEIRALQVIAMGYLQLGAYVKSLSYNDQAKELAIRTKNEFRLAITLNNIANIYTEQGDWKRGLTAYLELYEMTRSKSNIPMASKVIYLSNIGQAYFYVNQYDSAAVYLQKALPLAQQYNQDLISFNLMLLGDVAKARNQITEARAYYQQGIKKAMDDQDDGLLYEGYIRMGKFYQQIGQRDSTIHFAKQALSYSQKSSYPLGILNASKFLTEIYKGNNDSEALRYFETAMAVKDSLFSGEKVKQLLRYEFDARQKEYEIEAANAAYRSSLKTYIVIGLLVIFGTIISLLLRNNKLKQRANKKLQEQKEEIQSTLVQLKSTQSQLIQSEKMASLGELTAGIAHEIQNPLNFVNNFSELSVDLAKELKEEAEKPEIDKELIIDLATDLTQNQEKINHHGKRASDIVKGMLEHSRKSSGEKEPTDINALCDEYLRLAYHGMKAKDNDFNATFETHFDSNLPKIDVIPQDIGRVLLNLINNAFYAVNERSKKGEAGYQSTVSITTQLRGNTQLLIVIKDNGIGIPDAIKDKIFQPFFTTKPTGKGTGLGLSLSYDIMKAHGGELRVETIERAGSEFIILLPFKTNS